jgi:hypothetical protein
MTVAQENSSYFKLLRSLMSAKTQISSKSTFHYLWINVVRPTAVLLQKLRTGSFARGKTQGIKSKLQKFSILILTSHLLLAKHWVLGEAA